MERHDHETLQVLHKVLYARDQGLLTHNLYNLIAQLPEQREELIHGIAETLGVQSASLYISDEECLNDLPAFIDMESEEGVKQAAQAHPHVWWHLWQSEECAELYFATRRLYEAQYEGELGQPPLLVPVATRPRIPLLQLCREFLNSMLPLPNHAQVMGMAMTSATELDEVVLVDNEETEPGYQVSLSVREQAQENWDVLVNISPLPEGDLVLKMGEEEFRSNFDPQGNAQVTGIPASVFATSNAPGLMVAIELHEGSTFSLI